MDELKCTCLTPEATSGQTATIKDDDDILVQGLIMILFLYLTLQCTFRANGDHPNVKVEVEEVRTGVMMEVTNAGKRRRLILKTFITDLLGSKMVLKTTPGSLLVGKVNLQKEQDSSLEEVVEMMVIMNLLPLQLELTGTRLVCWVLMALDLLLNLPSIRQAEITLSTWPATLLTP